MKSTTRRKHCCLQQHGMATGRLCARCYRPAPKLTLYCAATAKFGISQLGRGSNHCCVTHSCDRQGTTALHHAATKGDLVISWLLIEPGADVNLQNAAGETPISVASLVSGNNVVPLLIEAGARVDGLVEKRLLSVWHAVVSGNIDVVNMIIESGAVTRDGCHNMAMDAAVASGSIEMAEALIKGGVPVKDQNLKDACLTKSPKMVKCVLDAGIKIKHDRGRSLAVAVKEKGCEEVVQTLLDANADVNDVPHILTVAVETASVDVIRMLLNAGACVNYQDYASPRYAQEHPLYAAVQKERVEIAIVLLEAGADPNQTGVKYNAKSPLFEACSRGLLEVVRALVGHGVRVASELEALGKAASNGYTEIVELLIAHGGSLGIGLLGSSFGGYTDIVKSLVLKNAKPGKSPLALAAEHGHVDVVNFLLDQGATVNVPSPGQPPLYLAARKNHVQIVKLLIARNADVNVPFAMRGVSLLCPSGSTALHAAASSGHRDMVKLLLSQGADPNVRDGDGKLPADIADGYRLRELLNGEDDDNSEVLASCENVTNPPMICIRTVPNEGETLTELRRREWGDDDAENPKFFLQLVKPKNVPLTRNCDLALRQNMQWIVGAREVRSALGLPAFGLATVNPRELPDGDEVFLQVTAQNRDAMPLSPHSAVMIQKPNTLRWRLVAEQALRQPQPPRTPSAAVLSVFVAKLARHEIALVEVVEDYLYYHVLVADHVKYFDYVGPRVPPSLIAPALKSPLRIPRILHAMFEIGCAWDGPESCHVSIRMPDSWDSHDVDAVAPWQHEYAEEFYEEYEELVGTKRVLRPEPSSDPDKGSLFHRGRGWFLLESRAAFGNRCQYELHVCIGDNICNGDVRGITRFEHRDVPSREMYVGDVEYVIMDLFRRVKSIATQESLKERFQILHPTSLFKSFNIERMDGSRPFASGASKGRACLKHSPWAEHLCFRIGNNLLHSSPGYPQKTKRRLFENTRHSNLEF
eukprot:m.76680 g.76680  ORF g.76680 m.76680 type:complete len:983 (-) comp10547_c0_seq2:50-2998(-)